MSKPLTITDTTFEESVLQSDKPVLVDFWAEWCGPCRQLAPVLDEIASEQDDVVIAKINIDENPEAAQRYKVMSIPTMMVFNEGAEKKRVVGQRNKSQLLQELAPFR